MPGFVFCLFPFSLSLQEFALANNGFFFFYSVAAGFSLRSFPNYIRKLKKLAATF
jgi:hypothetical protein